MPADAVQPEPAELKPAVFFDRDGTLMQETGYCSDPKLVQVFPGVPAALRRVRAAGFAIFIVTNQSGIGRGLFSEAQYRVVEDEFLRQAGRESIDGSYHCPDAPGTPSVCRKPEPGMVLRAAADHALDLGASYFVGDKAADIECGRRAGTRTILVLTGYGREQDCTADLTCADAVEAVDKIVADRIFLRPGGELG
jgi:D-glycero-D-manno-heptose 1,7-bisphosphate phosphatase